MLSAKKPPRKPSGVIGQIIGRTLENAFIKAIFPGFAAGARTRTRVML